MNEEIFQRLKIFTIKEACLSNELLSRATRLYEDLGITGDDAIDFILAYSKRFAVDVSNFMATDYFAGEGMNLINGNGSGKKVITLGDLEKGIIAGKLDDKVITQ